MPIPIPPLAAHIAASASSVLIAYLLHLPSFSLYSLHTYIHPDSVPSSTPRAVLRPPSADSSGKRSSKGLSSTPFDTTAAQLYRLKLSHSHLSTRLHFSSFNTCFLSSLFFSFPSLLLHSLLHSSNPFFPAFSAAISLSFLFFTLFRLSLDTSASRRSEQFFSLISFPLSPIVTLILIPYLSLHPAPGLALAVSGFISCLLFLPATRFARGFWIGTDQLHLDLPVLSCSSIGLFLLYLTSIVSLTSPFLFLSPFVPPFVSNLVETCRVPALAVAALLQLFSLRAILQMYLNEAVMCWYQRLHASRVPDLDYGRAKIFLHNHFLCSVATQLFIPPASVLLLLGLSQLRGNLFEGLVILNQFADCSDFVKEMCLFVAWWIMFAWSVLTMSVLACYRFGFLLVS